MSSQRKIDSARANGKKSHGPVTEEGRKHSSMNALKYGLCAETVVLPNEDGDAYTFLLDSYIQDLQPIGPVEMDLVTEMANAKWRQHRLYNVETDLYRQEMDKHKEAIEKGYTSYNENVEHAFAFRTLSESGSVAMLSRVESLLERAYSRALRDLLRLQAARKQYSEKRTESQERTPADRIARVSKRSFPRGTPANPSPPTPPERKPPTPSPSLNLTSPRDSDPITVPSDFLRPLTPTEPL